MEGLEEVMADAGVTTDDLEKAAEDTAAEPEESVGEPESAEAEETQGETDAAAEEEIPDEPDDHRERSRLGRRVSEIERMFKERLDSLEELIKSNSKPLEPERAVEPLEEEVEFPYDGQEEFERYLRSFYRKMRTEEEKRQEEELREYQRTYTRAAEVLLSQYEPEEAAMIEEMLRSEKYDRKWTDDPWADLQRNFEEAKKAALGGRKRNVRKPARALGVGGGSKPPPRKKILDLSGLDNTVVQVINDMRAAGVSEEKIAEYLEG